MATFASDDFSEVSGTAVTGKALDVGGTWGRATGGALANGQPTVDGSGGVYQGQNTLGALSAYLASATPPSADYTVSATINQKSVTSNITGVMARCPNLTSTNAGYYAYLTSTAIILAKWASNASTQLGTSPFSLPAGASVNLVLTVSGSSIQVSANGTTVISVTDTSFSAAGLAGIVFQSSSGPSSPTTGPHVQAFSAATLATNYTQSITASTTLTASLRKSAGRTIAVSMSSIASLRRAIGKPISATFTGTPSLSAAKRALANIGASFTGTVTMTRAVGHLVTQTVAASFVSVASLTARLNARVTIAAQVVPQVSISAGKAFRRTIAVAEPFTAFVGRIYAVTIAATFNTVASLFRASQSAPPPERLIQLGSANRIIDLPASADRIIEL